MGICRLKTSWSTLLRLELCLTGLFWHAICSPGGALLPREHTRPSFLLPYLKDGRDQPPQLIGHHANAISTPRPNMLTWHRSGPKSTVAACPLPPSPQAATNRYAASRRHLVTTRREARRLGTNLASHIPRPTLEHSCRAWCYHDRPLPGRTHQVKGESPCA
jgi:hypothetical protein